MLGGPPPDIATKVSVVQPNHGEPSTHTTSGSPGRASELPSKDRTKDRSEAPPMLWRWDKAKEVVLRPSIAGGLVGVGGLPPAFSIDERVNYFLQ